MKSAISLKVSCAIVVMVLMSIVSFAQNKTQEGSSVTIDIFKAGRVLSKSDIGFLNRVSKPDAPNERGDAPISVVITGKKYTEGVKLTAKDAKSLASVVTKYTELKKIKKSDSNRASCDWCYYNCVRYHYYWYNGWCICDYCY